MVSKFLINTLVMLIVLRGATAPSQATAADSGATRFTVLYDAFGRDDSTLRRDWGYSLFIERGGKRILFDTGNNPDTLARNAAVRGIDLARLDFVVMSHRHGDHMGGMAYLLKVNPNVNIYAPKERSGVYGDDQPSATWFRTDPSLPNEQRYYGGAPPEIIHMGAAWPGANLRLIDKTTEIAPGISVIALVSDNPGTMELRELSLALRTPEGLVLIVGCSHPGIDRIVQAAAAIDPHIHFVAGGFHLISATEPDIDKVVALLHDTYKVDYVAPGHCTGEPAFASLRRAFADHCLFAGLGTTLTTSGIPRSVP